MERLWILVGFNKRYGLIVGIVRFGFLSLSSKKEDQSQDLLACCSNLSAVTFLEYYSFLAQTTMCQLKDRKIKSISSLVASLEP